MPVRIRLTRMGKKKQPTYRVVVVDSRRARDSAYIEQIGRYDPRHDPSLIEIDNDRAVDWLRKGAQPSDRAKKLLEVSGAWTQFRVSRGDIHTIDVPAPPRQATGVEHEPEIHVVGTPGDEQAEDAVDVASAEEVNGVQEPAAAAAETEAASDSTDDASTEDGTGDEQA